MLCVLAFVPLWIAQMITGLVLIIVRLCYLLKVLLTLLFWVSTLCFVYCLLGLRPLAFTRHAIIWV